MKNILFCTISLCLLISCQEEVVKSDAYGNFETNTIVVSSQAKGKLLYLSVEEGQKVKAEKLVGIVDTVQLHLQKELLQSQKNSINGKTIDPNPEIDVLESQLENIKREKLRIERLVAAKAATSKQLDDINGEIEVIQQKMIAATQNAQVTNRGILSQKDPIDAQVNLTNAQIADCYIYNPIDGMVLNKLSEPNEIVGFGTPLYTIADMSTLTLRAYTDAISLQNVKLGDKVTVKVDGQDGAMNETEGVITWIANEAEFTPKIIQTKQERVNLVYALKIAVKNDGSLKIGMPAEVDFRNSAYAQNEG